MEDSIPTMKRLEETATYGKFVVEPLERGYGVTLGNSLRRVMLSSIAGAAVTSVRIEGVLHEFQIIPGLKEDTTELLLNLKELCIRVEPDAAARSPKHVLRLDRRSTGRITGADIECPDGVTVVNPECYLATIADEEASLVMEMDVEIGKGYVLPEKQEGEENQPIGTIPVGAAFTPVRKVNYIVEPRRLGFKTDYEGLVLEVTTNGTISPSAAISQASMILDRFYQRFMELAPKDAAIAAIEPARTGPYDEMPIEDLHFSTRTKHNLEKANVRTLGDLVRMPDSDLRKIKGLGQKSLDEIREKLSSLGIEREEAVEGSTEDVGEGEE